LQLVGEYALNRFDMDISFFLNERTDKCELIDDCCICFTMDREVNINNLCKIVIGDSVEFIILIMPVFMDEIFINTFASVFEHFGDIHLQSVGLCKVLKNWGIFTLRRHGILEAFNLHNIIRPFAYNIVVNYVSVCTSGIEQSERILFIRGSSEVLSPFYRCELISKNQQFWCYYQMYLYLLTADCTLLGMVTENQLRDYVYPRKYARVKQIEVLNETLRSCLADTTFLNALKNSPLEIIWDTKCYNLGGEDGLVSLALQDLKMEV